MGGDDFLGSVGTVFVLMLGVLVLGVEWSLIRSISLALLLDKC